MKKLFIILIVHCSLLIVNCFAQSITWQRTYTINQGDEEAFDICPADNNNYYLAGLSGPMISKVHVLKINQYGDTLWTKIYNYGRAFTVEPTDDGGCIFAGYAGQAFACRIKSNGDTLWLKTYNTINFLDMKRTLDDCYILCGANYSGGTYNGYVCKIDTSGNVIWERIYPAIQTLDILCIEPAIDGGFILGGQKKDYTGGPQTAYLAKINDTGSIVWQKQYILSISDIVSGIQAKNSGYIITGRSNDNAYLLKTNLIGDSINTKIFTNTSEIGYGPKLLIENFNKYYLAHINGYVSRVYSVDSSFNIIRQVELSASQNINSISVLSLLKVANSNSGDIITVGTSDYFQFANLDVYAARLDSSLSPPPPIGILNQLTTDPSEFKLLQNYPNPFNPETNIKFILKKKGDVKIKIYDCNGRVIKDLVNKFFLPGEYVTTFLAADLGSGIYFYQLLVNNSLIDSKKMCLIK